MHHSGQFKIQITEIDRFDATIASLRAAAHATFTGSVAIRMVLNGGMNLPTSVRVEIGKTAYGAVMALLPPASPFRGPLEYIRDKSLEQLAAQKVEDDIFFPIEPI